MCVREQCLIPNQPPSPPSPPVSCEGFCGGFNAVGGCFCDDLCTAYDDCCPDAIELVRYIVDAERRNAGDERFLWVWVCSAWLFLRCHHRLQRPAKAFAATLPIRAASVTSSARSLMTAALTPEFSADSSRHQQSHLPATDSAVTIPSPLVAASATHCKTDRDCVCVCVFLLSVCRTICVSGCEPAGARSTTTAAPTLKPL